ncbi:MAG: choice-of-anchor J domain-containing protein, partial [Ignavibacteriae bacterium]|nr:choice-of-anchor J domain-containing protein [Ignavibacteriota bacterium]
MRKFFVFLIIVALYTELFPQQLVIRLSEGFESATFPPTGWKRINLMGANQWVKLTAPLPPIINQPPIQGTAVARIDYQNEGGEDWLITKKITSIETGDSLFFYLIKQSDQGPFPPDSMVIRVSTTDSIQSSFSNVILRINIAGIPIGNQVWHKYSTPLTQFAGQNIFIAFQHKDVNGHGCAIDSVVV